MPWNPEIYNKFKQIRYKPFYDLMDLVDEDKLKKAIDLGCGTGEQTKMLSERFDQAAFIGIDSSQEMLAQSKGFETDNLKFKQSTMEEFASVDDKWDLIFSNAALQWVEHHEELFPRLISKLNPAGQFAVQMPTQKENVLNQLLLETVSQEPVREILGGFVRISPLLQLDDYARMMFRSGLRDLDISIRVYPIIANHETELFDFISGTTLIPYMERLDSNGQALLQSELLKKIRSYYSEFPAIYPFKRILLYGRKA